MLSNSETRDTLLCEHCNDSSWLGIGDGSHSTTISDSEVEVLCGFCEGECGFKCEGESKFSSTSTSSLSVQWL